MILCICFLLPFLTLISGQFGTSTVSTTTTTTTPMPFTTTSIFGGLLSSTMTPAAFTLSPGTVINATIITQRPDEAAFNSMISGLPSEAQNQVRNIRGNIFLTLVQQDQQITEILNAQGGSYSTVYNDIKNAVSLQAQNISTSMSSLTASAQSFVSRRQMVMNNTAIALFDFNGRLGSLASEFNGYSDSLKNEIYNFLVTHPLNGSFTVVMSSTTTTMMPPVSLNSTIENFIMSSVFLDGTTLPVKSFVDLLPQAQQTEFNNIINGNNRKDQIMTQLVQLVTGWGPQYAAAFNNTMTQRDQMMQSFMFLSGGLSEPYKTFVNRKLALMNNMTLTPTQESQSMQALISSFTAAKNALNQFTMSSSTPAPIFGR